MIKILISYEIFSLSCLDITLNLIVTTEFSFFPHIKIAVIIINVHKKYTRQSPQLLNIMVLRLNDLIRRIALHEFASNLAQDLEIILQHRVIIRTLNDVSVGNDIDVSEIMRKSDELIMRDVSVINFNTITVHHALRYPTYNGNLIDIIDIASEDEESMNVDEVTEDIDEQNEEEIKTTRKTKDQNNKK